MKTPREILFAKHKDVEGKLDAIRAAVVLECAQPEAQPAVNIFMALWQELVLPYRRIWSGLAVVWVGILALWVTEPGAAAQKTVRVAPQMAAAVIMEQRRELALVLGENGSSQVALPSPPPLPRPRSEQRQSFITV